MRSSCTQLHDGLRIHFLGQGNGLMEVILSTVRLREFASALPTTIPKESRSYTCGYSGVSADHSIRGVISPAEKAAVGEYEVS